MGSQLEVGSTFAGHRIDAVAGRGGMAVVYRATDLGLGRHVALKLIQPSMAQDDVFRARFERECRLAATIHHPHAVEIFHAACAGLDLPPQEVLHIGDDPALDVLGASAAGMRSAWLNRTGAV